MENQQTLDKVQTSHQSSRESNRNPLPGLNAYITCMLRKPNFPKIHTFLPTFFFQIANIALILWIKKCLTFFKNTRIFLHIDIAFLLAKKPINPCRIYYISSQRPQSINPRQQIRVIQTHAKCFNM